MPDAYCGKQYCKFQETVISCTDSLCDKVKIHGEKDCSFYSDFNTYCDECGELTETDMMVVEDKEEFLECQNECVQRPTMSRIIQDET